MSKMVVQPNVGKEVMHLSRTQNGAIDEEQLRSAGLTRSAIRSRVARGRLVPVFRGVYAVGDPELMPLARPAGALLSLGQGSCLSHRSSASIWRLAEAHPLTVDVTVVGRNPRPRAGVRLHRVKRLSPDDVTTHSKLRLTSPARTLIDFAIQATSAELHDAFGEARAKRLVNDGALHAALAHVPRNHRGAAIVRSMLRAGDTYDRSKAERLLRSICRRAQLPEPLVNIHLNGFLVDFFWPDAKLIVEVDGYATHGTRQAFEDDRRRDQVHVAAGYAIVRVTWHQLRYEPMAVLARIAQALAQRAA